MGSATRVIKNTGFLFVRMGITVFVSLYSTRLILQALGESDFGIYNVVGGAIGMLGFLNYTMANATQRFMSYAEGEGILEKKKKVFNVSMTLHVAIALLTVLIFAIAYFPLFNGILNIEPSRIGAAKIVYLSLICTSVLTITNVPYDAIMNAHENMLYYSIIGILVAFLKLGVAFICLYASSDKLILYAILSSIIPLVNWMIMKVYCHRHYEECVIKPIEYYDSSMVKSIASFSGWNFLTAISNLITGQGIGIVLNHFFGTRLNTAHGIAHQISGHSRAFAENMKKALNPVIVKNAGSKNIALMNRAANTGNKYMSMLSLLLAVPLFGEMPFVLGVWLKTVPEWAILFCRLQLVLTIFSMTVSNTATSVYATGKIKYYAIFKSVMNLLPILFTYICFKLGGGPYWLYIPMFVFWGLGGNIVIVYFACKLCNLSLLDYLNEVLKPVLSTLVLMACAGFIVITLMPSGVLRFLVCSFATTTTMMLSMWIWWMSREEKNAFLTLINKRIRMHKAK